MASLSPQSPHMPADGAREPEPSRDNNNSSNTTTTAPQPQQNHAQEQQQSNSVGSEGLCGRSADAQLGVLRALEAALVKEGPGPSDVLAFIQRWAAAEAATSPNPASPTSLTSAALLTNAPRPTALPSSSATARARGGCPYVLTPPPLFGANASSNSSTSATTAAGAGRSAVVSARHSPQLQAAAATVGGPLSAVPFALPQVGGHSLPPLGPSAAVPTASATSAVTSNHQQTTANCVPACSCGRGNAFSKAPMVSQQASRPSSAQRRAQQQQHHPAAPGTSCCCCCCCHCARQTVVVAAAPPSRPRSASGVGGVALKTVPSWTMGVSVSALTSPVGRGPSAAHGGAAGVFPIAIFPTAGPQPQRHEGTDGEGEGEGEGECMAAEGAASISVSVLSDDAPSPHSHSLSQSYSQSQPQSHSLTSPVAAVAIVDTNSHRRHYNDRQRRRVMEASADGGNDPSKSSSQVMMVSVAADPLEASAIVAGESSFFSTERPVKLKELKKLFPPPNGLYSLVRPTPAAVASEGDAGEEAIRRDGSVPSPSGSGGKKEVGGGGSPTKKGFASFRHRQKEMGSTPNVIAVNGSSISSPPQPSSPVPSAPLSPTGRRSAGQRRGGGGNKGDFRTSASSASPPPSPSGNKAIDPTSLSCAVIAGQGNYGTVCKGYKLRPLPSSAPSQQKQHHAQEQQAVVVALKISKIKDKWSLDEVEALRHCSYVAGRVLAAAGLSAPAEYCRDSRPASAAAANGASRSLPSPDANGVAKDALTLGGLDPHLVAGALRIVTLQGRVCYDPRRHSLWIPLPWLPLTLEGLIKHRMATRRGGGGSQSREGGADAHQTATPNVGVRRAASHLPPPLFSIAEIQCVFRQLLQAVHFFARAARVVHLDIKPANVLIRPEGAVAAGDGMEIGNGAHATVSVGGDTDEEPLSYDSVNFGSSRSSETVARRGGGGGSLGDVTSSVPASGSLPLFPSSSSSPSPLSAPSAHALPSSIVLCDYGLMQHCGGELVQLGDYLYMSPEVFYCDVTAAAGSGGKGHTSGDDVSSSGDDDSLPPRHAFSEQNDVWSVGCVVLEMLDGLAAMAWDSADAFAALKDNYVSPSPRHVSQWPGSLVHCVALCFERDSRARLSARELLDHPFFRTSFGPDGGCEEGEGEGLHT